MQLNPGEVICDKCNGTKSMLVDKFYYFKCTKCNGLGKLDWVENVVGKKQQLTYDSTSWNSCNLVR